MTPATLPPITDFPKNCPIPALLRQRSWRRPWVSFPVATSLAVLQAVAAAGLFLYARGGAAAVDRGLIDEVRKHGSELAQAEMRRNAVRYEELIQRIARLEEGQTNMAESQRRIEQRLDALLLRSR